jgi:predicted kinase
MAIVYEHPCALKAVQHSDCRDASMNGTAASAAQLSPATLFAQLHGKKTTRVSTSSVEESTGCVSDAYYSGSGRQAEAGAVGCTGFSVRKKMTADSNSIVVVLVGLPARGKSFVSRKVESFFIWQGLQTRVFNVGKYRRATANVEESGRADFFDSSNKKAQAAREEAASLALNDVFEFLDKGGHVAIFDATNSTRQRRRWIVERTRAHQLVGGTKSYRVIFVESVCDDPEVVQTNMWNKVLSSPDFPGMTPEQAFQDFKQRVTKYEEVYETMGSKEEDDFSYIKLFNMSSKVLLNRIYGSIAKSVLPYLMAIHIGTRPIWLVRASETAAVRESFVARLCAFVERRVAEHYGEKVPPSERHLKVLCSSATSAVETMFGMQVAGARDGSVSGIRFKQTSALNPMNVGNLRGDWCCDPSLDHFPLEELRRRHPGFSARWKAGKGRVRFPGGESYFDVMSRVEGCLLEAEMSTRPVMCISHVAPLQVLSVYFQGLPIEEAWNVYVPQGSVIEVVPTLGGGFRTNVICLMDESVAVDTDMLARGSFKPQKRASCIASISTAATLAHCSQKYEGRLSPGHTEDAVANEMSREITTVARDESRKGERGEGEKSDDCGEEDTHDEEIEGEESDQKVEGVDEEMKRSQAREAEVEGKDMRVKTVSKPLPKASFVTRRRASVL